MTLSEPDWEARFTSIKPEPELIRETSELPENMRQCWTVVDADGVYYIIPGVHTVNAVGYVATKEEWSDSDLLSEWYW